MRATLSCIMTSGIMKRLRWATLFAFGLLLADAGSPAAAQPRPAQPRPAQPRQPGPRRAPPAAPQPAGGVLNLGEITITGRPQKPIAAVDVGRIPAKLTLTELKQSFVDRIDEAAFKEPF